jgi:hypothetical protein
MGMTPAIEAQADPGCGRRKCAEISMIEAGYGRRMNLFEKRGERFAVTPP